MLTIGQKFPQFSKTAVVSIEKGKEFETITSDFLVNEDNVWTVMFWWPKDFTFVCPTEISEFNKSYSEFRDRDTRLIGASTDDELPSIAMAIAWFAFAAIRVEDKVTVSRSWLSLLRSKGILAPRVWP